MGVVVSFRGEFCRILDRYKSGKWTRDEAVEALEKYFRKHLNSTDEELLEILNDWLLEGKYNE